jgi:hypothetical protein
VNLKKTLATIGGAIALTAGSLALTAGPSFGADNGTITASIDVRVAGPCLLVETPTISFGSDIALPESGNAVARPGTDAIVRNCGGFANRILVRASDFSAFAGPAAGIWTLRASGGNCVLNQAALSFTSSGGAIAGDVLTTDRTFITSLPGTFAAQPLASFLHLPCSGSMGQGQTMRTSITFTALVP